jgi:S-adenosylmethionine hydrolase
MFNWLFRNKKKEAAANHKAELNAKIANKLKNYNVDEDISVSSFSEIDFNENKRKETGKKDRVKNVDTWGQANPSETGKLNKENRRQIDRRQANRRRADSR